MEIRYRFPTRQSTPKPSSPTSYRTANPTYSNNSTTSPGCLVKMVAYRAESAMLPGVGLLKREAEEGRAFLKTLFQTPADLIPLEEEKQLLVRYHSMAQRRFNTALRTLCDAATLGSHRFPGTDLRLVFQGPSVTNQTDPGQEV